MSAKRVLAIGLDGYEVSLADRLMAEGELPHLARLRRDSAHVLLDHGPAQRTGLAWEHVSTGLSPEAAARYAAVAFDSASYKVWQEGTSMEPFMTRLHARTVVFDAPYLDLGCAPTVQGVVDWGAHDPGAPAASRPRNLVSELRARFGAYPAKDWIYGFVWPSAARCKQMGNALTEAVNVRSRAARWLLGERLPNWDLALVVVGEPHSATEGLWHGVDPEHPLHGLPSSTPARDGLYGVYRAVDRLVGGLIEDFPDATVVVFSMGGMGPNRSDVASMVLLPELLYRHAYGRSLLRQPSQSSDSSADIPMLRENEEWNVVVNSRYPIATRWREALRKGVSDLLPGMMRRALKKAVAKTESSSPLRLSLEWMPATRYQSYWSDMRAFALPSFYDGRVRVNLEGREGSGKVRLKDYGSACDEIEAVVRACRDPLTGKEVVDEVERSGRTDPVRLGPTESDLVILWRGALLALDHPTLGRVGPVPFRRPGGHTGPYGMAYVRSNGIKPGDLGVKSSFDVVPTIVSLLGDPAPEGLSGGNLLAGNVRIFESMGTTLSFSDSVVADHGSVSE